MTTPITILFPVYNDTESLQIVLQDISKLKDDRLKNLSFVIVNDGSSSFFVNKITDENKITVIHLSRNLGHQKAIAIGLSWIKENYKGSTVIVMDADGEDKVLDLQLLLDANEKLASTIFFAARKRRTNGMAFKLFYSLYKLSFYLLTGKKISFGNFSIMPYYALCKVVYYSEIWNNYPGGIMKSGLTYEALPTDRGNRYAGKSKMNFTTLLLHGFGAIAVFLEIIISRIAVISFLLIIASVISLLTILIIKTTTTMAIPGWASTLGSSMIIILLISFIISLFSIFIYLSTQTQRKFIPAMHYHDYILQTEII